MSVFGFQLANFQIIFDSVHGTWFPVIQPSADLSQLPVWRLYWRLSRSNARLCQHLWGVSIIGLASLAGMAIFVRDPKKKPLALKPVKGS